MLFWIFVLILLPQLLMVDFSFRHNLPPPEYGGPNDVYTLEHYQFWSTAPRAAAEFNAVDLSVFFRTLLAAMFVTLFDLVLCYPIAYYLAQSKGSRRAGRAVADHPVLGQRDPARVRVPHHVRRHRHHQRFSHRDRAARHSPSISSATTSRCTPGSATPIILLMIFPIYNAIESLDRNQIEAARDMGAPWWRIHWRVVIPYAKPGITSGCTMVFMLSAGALAAPQILGGPSSLWFTQIIYQWFKTNNWPRIRLRDHPAGHRIIFVLAS